MHFGAQVSGYFSERSQSHGTGGVRRGQERTEEDTLTLGLAPAGFPAAGRGRPAAIPAQRWTGVFHLFLTSLEVEWLADPATDPEADALLAERMGGALQVVLDALTPAERAAFVLHDVFGYPFEEVGAVMGRSSTAVRRIASRARRKMRGLPESAEQQTARAESRQVVDAFLKAARGGDLAGLMTLLSPDAVMRTDLISQAMGTEQSYEGAGTVADRFNGTRGAMKVTIDGELGAAWFQAGTVKVAFVFHVVGGLIDEVELIADPDVLATMEIVRVRSRAPGTATGSTDRRRANS